jgi:hypothetical protein
VQKASSADHIRSRHQPIDTTTLLAVAPEARHQVRRLLSIRRRACSTTTGGLAGTTRAREACPSARRRLALSRTWLAGERGRPRSARLRGSGGWPVCGRVGLRTPPSQRSDPPSAMHCDTRAGSPHLGTVGRSLLRLGGIEREVGAFQAADKEVRKRVAPAGKASPINAGSRQSAVVARHALPSPARPSTMSSTRRE